MIEQTQGKFYTNVNLLPANRKEKSRKNTIFIWDWTELGRSWWKHFFPNLKGQAYLKGHGCEGKEGREGWRERPMKNPQPKEHLKDPSLKTHTSTQNNTWPEERQTRSFWNFCM